MNTVKRKWHAMKQTGVLFVCWFGFAIRITFVLKDNDTLLAVLEDGLLMLSKLSTGGFAALYSLELFLSAEEHLKFVQVSDLLICLLYPSCMSVFLPQHVIQAPH